ncbi:hypothetical protein CTAYLR_000486 [Chrysophaeum taylorii]|uniref:DNA-(apurinic or apyrimidinic site) lyase n=1 Tax=Chrysophaeum taylorii TaxID=2483200 RepID=A0AAD7XMY8_9STRA|nr:hypothetical protein CTAYLR_000486 [Chrysophaeum taylorii]
MKGDEDDEAVVRGLREYFQVSETLEPLYARWAGCDPRMAEVAAAIEGARVIRQDPVECLTAFICSSNNNIPRITLMLRRLRERFGTRLCEGVHAFPTLEALAAANEADLRDLGFGYRAPYVVATARLALEKGGRDYLLGLRGQPRLDVQTRLLEFKGVGRKVADCVALFSLDIADAIPVDTHVWRLARRDFDPTLQDVRSLTPAVYERVGDLFRDRFGDRAGWAHSLLFAAELPAFEPKLPAALVKDMRDFKAYEKRLNKEHRADVAAMKKNDEAAADEDAVPPAAATTTIKPASTPPRRKKQHRVVIKPIDEDQTLATPPTPKRSRRGRQS